MNELTIIQPRQTALTPKDFNKLESLVEKNFDLKEKYTFGSVETTDECGVHKWERGIIGTELQLTPNGDINPLLTEALQRPYSNPSVGVHITRLSVHKGFKGGDFGLQVVIEDAIKDLSGKSEWALVKACEEIRKDAEKFFSYPVFVDLVNKYHNALFQDSATDIDVDTKKVEEFIPDTAEQKAKVAELIKNSLNRMEK